METCDAKARAEAHVLWELRRRARILLPSFAVLLAASGCSDSLFGLHSHRDGGDGGTGGDDDASVPETCSASCIADAAADFDAMSNNGWQYLGDKRDRMWTPMTPAAKAMVGDANNRVERCTDNASAAACQGLPGALLVTSSGSASPSDPAVQYAATKAQVLQLALRAFIPSSSVAQRVRLYRNSREDVLYTATAAPGATVMQAVTVDALAGDRFLVAFEPTGAQGGTAALQFFVIDPHTTFPSTCQLALTFSDGTITQDTVRDECRGQGFTYLNDTMPTPPLLVTGPFNYQGMGLYFENPFYLAGSQLLPEGDRTIQFWVQQGNPSTRAWVFSDIDEDLGHGSGVAFTSTPTTKLEATVATSTNPLTYTSLAINIASPQTWHFVRVVHAGGTVKVCLDGDRVTNGTLPGPIAPARAPTLGRSTQSFDDFNGQVDDVRVFAGTLPCNNE